MKHVFTVKEYPFIEKMDGKTRVHLNENIYVEMVEKLITIVEHSNPNAHKTEVVNLVWEY